MDALLFICVFKSYLPSHKCSAENICVFNQSVQRYHPSSYFEELDLKKDPQPSKSNLLSKDSQVNASRKFIEIRILCFLSTVQVIQETTLSLSIFRAIQGVLNCFDGAK